MLLAPERRVLGYAGSIFRRSNYRWSRCNCDGEQEGLRS